MNQDSKKPSKIKVIIGHCVELEMAGWTLDRIQIALRTSIGIDKDMKIYLDGNAISGGRKTIGPGQVLAFLHDGLPKGDDDSPMAPGLGCVNVIHGPHGLTINVAGYTVAEVQLGLRDEMHLDVDTPAYVDGRRVEDKSQILEPGQRLEFLRDSPLFRRRRIGCSDRNKD